MIVGELRSLQIAVEAEHFLVDIGDEKVLPAIAIDIRGVDAHAAAGIPGLTIGDAENEAAFWSLAEHRRTAQEKLGAPFAEYLRRVLLHNAPLAAPRDVAGILASYARDALARVEHADTPACTLNRGQCRGRRKDCSRSCRFRCASNNGFYFL